MEDLPDRISRGRGKNRGRGGWRRGQGRGGVGRGGRGRGQNVKPQELGSNIYRYQTAIGEEVEDSGQRDFATLLRQAQETRDVSRFQFQADAAWQSLAHTGNSNFDSSLDIPLLSNLISALPLSHRLGLESNTCPSPLPISERVWRHVLALPHLALPFLQAESFGGINPPTEEEEDSDALDAILRGTCPLVVATPQGAVPPHAPSVKSQVGGAGTGVPVQGGGGGDSEESDGLDELLGI